MADTISVKRFIEKLDGCFGRNDLKGAEECLVFWEAEARRLDDNRGLATVLNEAAGFYRRTRNKDRADAVVSEIVPLIDTIGLSDSSSGAIMLINAATTAASFGNVEKALSLYDRSAKWFESHGDTGSYEYASLLNNRAGLLEALKRYDEAERDWLKAIEILKKIGYHAGEIAISLLLLAHLTYDRDDSATDKVEALLDEAWEYINSKDQPRDGRYAFVLTKCAPVLEYFKRTVEAQACRDVAEEIYSGKA